MTALPNKKPNVHPRQLPLVEEVRRIKNILLNSIEEAEAFDSIDEVSLALLQLANDFADDTLKTIRAWEQTIPRDTQDRPR